MVKLQNWSHGSGSGKQVINYVFLCMCKLFSRPCSTKYHILSLKCVVPKIYDEISCFMYILHFQIYSSFMHQFWCYSDLNNHEMVVRVDGILKKLPGNFLKLENWYCKWHQTHIWANLVTHFLIYSSFVHWFKNNLRFE